MRPVSIIAGQRGESIRSALYCRKCVTEHDEMAMSYMGLGRVLGRSQGLQSSCPGAGTEDDASAVAILIRRYELNVRSSSVDSEARWAQCPVRGRCEWVGAIFARPVHAHARSRARSGA